MRLIATMGTMSLALLFGMMVRSPIQAAPAARDGNGAVEQPARTETAAQTRKRRVPTRLRVYPKYSYPGPNAVRQCEAHYEQEFRQAGTVIVPRMHCWWQPG